MTTQTTPIDPARFALALESLPLDALHAKAAELRNSITHLKSSNEQMLPFADEGDAECREAMFENLAVIGRMNERVRLLREEVEKRGFLWGQDDAGDGKEEEKVANGVNGIGGEGEEAVRNGNGRLTDEELRRRMEAQMAEAEAEEGEGVHL